MPLKAYACQNFDGLPPPGARRTAIVVSYGPKMHADVDRARRIRRDAVMLGVKFACMLYSDSIRHVWTQHPEQAESIRARAPGPVYLHTRDRIGRCRKARGELMAYIGHIDYVWPALHWAEDSSGFAAGLWARHCLGFEEVILCGVPMECTGYVPEIAEFKPVSFDSGQSFIGRDVMDKWRERVTTYMRLGITLGIKSMSGWTRQQLGAAW